MLGRKGSEYLSELFSFSCQLLTYDLQCLRHGSDAILFIWPNYTCFLFAPLQSCDLL